MDTGLTTLSEKDIAKHFPTAQSLVTRLVLLEASTGKSKTELAGTKRRFVSTVSTSGTQKILEKNKTPFINIGNTSGENLTIKDDGEIVINLSVSKLRDHWKNAIWDIMG